MGKGVFIGLASGGLWAIAGIIYQIIYLNYPELYSFFFSLFVLLAIEIFSLASISLVFIRKKSIPKLTRNNIIVIFSGVFGGPIAMISYLKAIELIEVSYAASISAIYPIFVAIFQIIRKENNFKQLLLLLISVGSVITLNISSFSISNMNYLGVILSIVAALSWSLEIISSSFAINKNNQKVEDVYFIRQIFSVFGYIISIVFILSSFKENPIFIEYNLAICVLLLAISSGLSYFLYYKAIDILKPIRAMSLNMTYGIWAIILSSIILNREISIETIIIILVFFISVFNLFNSEKK